MSDDSATDMEFVTFSIANRWFGALVTDIQDVFELNGMTPVPMARSDIAGLLNLRGRIVTAIDARRRLNLPPREISYEGATAIGIERDGEAYAIIIDEVGEVARFSAKQYEPTPNNLEDVWREIAVGVYRAEDRLILAVDLQRMLDPPGGGLEQAA